MEALSEHPIYDDDCEESGEDYAENYLCDFDEFESDCESEPCYFSLLPDELTARIFTYLHPVRDALPRLGNVCSKWRKILKETSRLWRKIHIHSASYKGHDYEVLANIFRVYGSQIQQLTWQPGSRVYESAFNWIPRLTSLTVLRLPILWNHWVVETLAPLSKLEEVLINGGFELTDRDLITAACNYPNLRRVTLNSCWSVTDRGVEHFLSSLPRLVDCKLKINVGLPLADVRSDHAMLQGSMIARTVAEGTRAESITMLSLNFVPIETEELWGVVNSLTRLNKLCISNCERLQGIRFSSASLQKVYLFNLWSVLFVSISAPMLRLLQVDSGLESCEHLEIYAGKLRTLQIDGSNTLRTLVVRSGRVNHFEVRNCQDLDPHCLQAVLLDNPFIGELRLGAVATQELMLDHITCPSVETISILNDFACTRLLVRCPNLRVIQTAADDLEILSLQQVIVVADHLTRVRMVGLPALHNLLVQCDSVQSVEIKMCGDESVCLRSFVVQATRSIGLIRFLDCAIGALILSAPRVHTMVVYRCYIEDYTLQMALNGCPNIVHLSVEKCNTISQVCVPNSASLLKYLNLYGCHGLVRVAVDSAGILAINLGQCSKARLFVRGIEYDLSLHPVCKFPKVVLPHQSLRWSHDHKPQLFNIP